VFTARYGLNRKDRNNFHGISRVRVAFLSANCGEKHLESGWKRNTEIDLIESTCGHAKELNAIICFRDDRDELPSPPRTAEILPVTLL